MTKPLNGHPATQAMAQPARKSMQSVAEPNLASNAADYPPITVIVPAYNEEKAVRAQVEAIHHCLQTAGIVYEIIVVDDGSSDGSVEMVRNWPSPYSLRCIAAAHQGSGPARNLGVSCAKGEIIIFIDDDAFAAPWFVSEHIRSH